METVTDAEGYFEFNNLEGGYYEIIAVDADGKEHILGKVSLKEDTVMKLKLKYEYTSIADNSKKEIEKHGFNLTVVGVIALAACISAAFVIVVLKKVKKN